MSWLVLWLVILVVCIIIELFTLGITVIWFGAGALAAALISFLDAPGWSQCLAFAVVSFLLFAFVRPTAKRKFDKKRRMEQFHDMAGKRGIVVSEIDSLRGIGSVRVGGKNYAAVSRERGIVIPGGAVVDVVGAVKGKLIVCLDDSMVGNMELKESDVTLDPSYFYGEHETKHDRI